MKEGLVSGHDNTGLGARTLLNLTSGTDNIAVGPSAGENITTGDSNIAIGSGLAFLVAQLLDVQIFDNLRKNSWYVAPLISSSIGSIVDTFLFFSIAFAGTDVPWITLSLGDLAVKFFVALVMLVPFRLLLNIFKPVA